MQRILCLMAGLFVYGALQAQKPQVEIDCQLEEGDKIFTRIENPAEFKGRVRGWFQFAQENFDFKTLAKHLNQPNRRFEDSAILKFALDREGNICSIRFLHGHPLLRQPTIDVLRKSSPWIPGITGNRQVYSYRTIRISVILDEANHIDSVKHYNGDYDNRYIDEKPRQLAVFLR